MYRFEQDEGRRTKFTRARLNLASQVQYHYQLQYCTGTDLFTSRLWQVARGGLADGERPQTDPCAWQVVE